MRLKPENDLTRVDSLPQQRLLDPRQEAVGSEQSSDGRPRDQRFRHAHRGASKDTIPTLFDDRSSAGKFGSRVCWPTFSCCWRTG